MTRSWSGEIGVGSNSMYSYVSLFWFSYAVQIVKGISLESFCMSRLVRILISGRALSSGDGSVKSVNSGPGLASEIRFIVGRHRPD